MEPAFIGVPGAARPTSPPAPTPRDDPSLRPLLVFAAITLPLGWVLLSAYQVLGLPQEPFALATTLLGLVPAALLLTARQHGRDGVRRLLRDVVRLPRPWWWLPVAMLALPAVVWSVASLLGGAVALTSAVLVSFTVDLLVGAVVINLWEEMAWTGFVQRRSMARWGVVVGSLFTALLFAGIHLPLAFDGAHDAGDVVMGVGVLVATGIGLRLLIAGVDTWSGRSLLTIGLLHASFNSTADLVDADHDWVRLLTAVLLGVVAVAVVTTGRHSRPLS